jgi:hypothetical protein
MKEVCQAATNGLTQASVSRAVPVPRILGLDDVTAVRGDRDQPGAYVAPMRLEFKVERPDYMSDAAWEKVVAGGYGDFQFNVLVGDEVVPLAVPAGQSADKYFSSRSAAMNPDAVYLSVNLAITDAPYTGVEAVLADSKTDLYTVNPTYLASNPDPFPERGAIEQRGFSCSAMGSRTRSSLRPTRST